MATDTFLAMTAAEFGDGASLPPKIAWMACHFSPYSTGISNCPKKLPPDSLLILNDRTPIHGHDREVIAAQLTDCVTAQKCRGVLLDFQRPNCRETAALAAFLPAVLPCPTVVSTLYAGNTECPVFLPPAPCCKPLGEHTAPWKGRELWLELALDGEVITVTESGAAISPLPAAEAIGDGYREENLHCHYTIAVSEKEAKFTLWREKEDLETLLEEAEDLGITTAVGLYQELH